MIIAKYGAGFDNIDINTCSEQGILVTNAPQAPTDSVAQATLGMCIACAHKFKKYDKIIHSSGFDGPILENMGTELTGKTLGVIGFGRIGNRLTELVAPFDMVVKVYDPYLPAENASEANIKKTGLDELIRTSDFVSLHCPLTQETSGMLTRSHFDRMKDSAYLINTTRGGIYADADLAEAVQEGWIAGAAVDVFENESDVSRNPLIDIPKILATPHVAGLTQEALTKYGQLCAEAILQAKRGKIPQNILNPQVIERQVPAEKISPSFRN
jgi:D-3-phosphoglycerate dehydrogenase